MKTPTTVLLAVIAALLAANLFVNLPPQEAKAQLHHHPPPPTVVTMSIHTTPSGEFARVFRLWSDGSVDTTRVIFETLPESLMGCEILDTCTRDVPFAP